MKKIIIYTDGACRNNPGEGGWGALLIYGKHEKSIYGYQKEATNNQMELMAAIKALEHLKEACEIDLYTDSKYLMNGVTLWLPNWKKNNFKTASKKPVKNQSLWMQLEEVSQPHKVSYHWVKGHVGNEGNEKADALANLGIDEKKEGCLLS